MTISGKYRTLNNCLFTIIADSEFGIVTKVLTHKLLVLPTIVTESLSPIVISVSGNFGNLSSEASNVVCLVSMTKMPDLLCFSPSVCFLLPPAVDEFQLQLFVQVGRDNLNQRLDEVVSHY